LDPALIHNVGGEVTQLLDKAALVGVGTDCGLDRGVAR
jgi:hypothetical protein